MEGYKFFDHTADVMFEAYGSTLGEMFANAGLAVSETMVELDGVSGSMRKEFSVSNKEVDMLLFSFLEELIYYKDVEQLVFSKFEVEVNSGKARIIAYGDKLDFKKMKFGVDVKAVTLHKFKVWEDHGWKCRVILDI
tara:strand:- start:4034 stop:4444 length:411 start_codon:yes stop_codon:yes gene_type:complete